ncbi:MAG: carboxypeptidase-like regulatory domain-containing protein [Dehalococcoidia bacterium]
MFASVPRGALTLTASFGEDLWGEFNAPDADSDHIVVDLHAGRHIDLLVRFERSEEPISGAAVIAYDDADRMDAPWLTVVTDERGRATVGPLPNDASIYFDVVRGEFTWPGGPGHPASLADAHSTSMVLEVPDPTRIELELTFLDGEEPPDGTVVSFETGADSLSPPFGVRLPASGEIVNGRLGLDLVGWGWVRGIARFPGNRVGLVELRPDLERGAGWHEATVYVSLARAIRVQVVDQWSRSPVGDVLVAARLPAGNLLRSERTDRAGEAELAGLPPVIVALTASATPPHAGVHHAGRTDARALVDLRSGGNDVTLEVGPRMDCRLEVLVAGVPQVPPGTRVMYREVSGAARWISVSPDRVDTSAGLIWFQIRVPSAVTSPRSEAEQAGVELQVTAPGFGVVEARLPTSIDGTHVLQRVTLSREVSLLVSVLGWEDAWGLPELQVWDRDARRWRAYPRGPSVASRSAERLQFRGLAAGEYRLSAPLADLTGSPFSISTSDSVIERRWDLRGHGWAEGTINLPDELDESLLEVLVDGEAAESRWSSPRVSGRFFRVHVPGDRPVEISLRHPALDPARRPSVIVTAPQSGLLLEATAR